MSTRALVTAEELARMPNDTRRELVEGEIRELSPTGGIHGLVAGNFQTLVGAFVRQHRLGFTGTAEVGYLLARNPDTVRVPDVSFVSRERIPETGIPEGFWSFAPDLAIEVLSPTDSAEEVLEKVEMYLAAGTRMVWVASPRARSITVYTPGGGARVLHEGDELEGGDVLPDFSVPVEEIFAVHF